MPQLKIAIITAKLGTYDAASSTLIADEAISRKHIIYEFEPAEMKYSEGKLLASARQYPKNKKLNIDLAKMDVILFRPNPPVDMAYLTTLFLLRTLENDVLIINSPTSVINFPEKIFPLYLKKFMPPTLITSDASEIKKFAARHGEIVIKPLYDFGGNDIIRLKKGQGLDKKYAVPVVAQKFIPQVVNGDKRVLFVDGEVAGAILRKPQKGSFIANIAKGGGLHKTTLTAQEKKICAALTPIFKENNIMIAGIDIIHGKLTEVNITSPTGFKWAEDFSGINAKKILLDRIEKKCR